MRLQEANKITIYFLDEKGRRVGGLSGFGKLARRLSLECILHIWRPHGLRSAMGGVERTLTEVLRMAADDPKRTLALTAARGATLFGRQAQAHEIGANYDVSSKSAILDRLYVIALSQWTARKFERILFV